MTRPISRSFIALFFLFTISLVGCGSSETVKLETPDGVDWAALEKQDEALAKEMNSREK